MNPNHDPESLDLRELALECANQENLYRRSGKGTSDPRFCYELFRRAVVHQDQAAWSLVYQQYESQVVHWVRQNPVFHSTQRPADDFVNEAFARFWRAVSPQKFTKNLKTLESVLLYLKKCVASTLYNYQRTIKREERKESIILEMQNPTVERSVEKQLSKKDAEAQLWELIESLSKNEREKAAIENFTLEKKASQIREDYSHLFADAKSIYRTKENLLKRFRRNPKLKIWLPGGGGKRVA
jgi:RNA polymerase sigma factor (sigma-70 family)